jgi:hypothetical protein
MNENNENKDSLPEGPKLRYPRAQLFRKYLWHDGSFAHGCAGILFGVVFTGIGLLMLSMELPYWLKGVAAKGTVTGKRLSAALPNPGGRVCLLAHGGGGRKAIVSYTFEDNGGAKVHGSSRINRWKWDALQAGDAIDICYVQDTPERNRPAGPRWEAFFSFYFALFGSVFLTTSTVTIIRRLRWIREQIAVLEFGQATSALIDRCVERSLGRKRRKVCDVHYHYLVPGNGAAPMVLEGMQTVTTGLRHQLQAGSLAVVIFDPADPKRHALDVFRACLDVPREAASLAGAKSQTTG